MNNNVFLLVILVVLIFALAVLGTGEEVTEQIVRENVRIYHGR